uniref:Lysozyme n=1 Tax=Rhabditophanes sp. KR3021 TaxID=114890 RepID=A0AC35TKX7_9BILA
MIATNLIPLPAILFILTISASAKTCFDCLCSTGGNECKDKPCSVENGIEFCGYFHLSQDFYVDCGLVERSDAENLTVAFKRCASDLECSKKCINNYYQKYHSNCDGKSKCNDVFKLMKGGVNGCNNEALNSQWQAVLECYDKNEDF